MQPDPKIQSILLKAYALMHTHFGPRNWWPADSPFEVIIGAILTQNTAWTNVEKAIQNIKNKNALSVHHFQEISEEELAAWIRPSGYYNIKARRLKAFINFFCKAFNGKIDKMAKYNGDDLRIQLLNVYGIGKETADSILLYALEKPFFVVDAYTHRIFSRHRLISEDASYEETQKFFMHHLPRNVAFYNEYHALIVETGKTFCGKNPKCPACPLVAFHDGPTTLRC
jgi:endonuclease-3 related protein